MTILNMEGIFVKTKTKYKNTYTINIYLYICIVFNILKYKNTYTIYMYIYIYVYIYIVVMLKKDIFFEFQPVRDQHDPTPDKHILKTFQDQNTPINSQSLRVFLERIFNWLSDECTFSEGVV